MPENAPTILWVGAPEKATPHYWDARLAQAGLEVDRIDDVHVALARLGRGKIAPVAIVVCVDFLGPSEFEFFTLVSRYHRRTALFAYSDVEASDQLAAALRAGARQTLTAERLERLLEEVTGPKHAASQMAPGDGRVPACEEDPMADSCSGLPSALAEDSHEPIHGPLREDQSAEREETGQNGSGAVPGAVRVPWRKNADGPVRTPPTRKGLSADLGWTSSSPSGDGEEGGD